MNLKILALTLLIPLAGCQTAGAILGGTVSNPVTPTRAAILHGSFYGGVLAASADYAALDRCPAPQPCSDQKVVNSLRTYVNGAEDALNKLDAWAFGNTSLNGPALYDAAVNAIEIAQTFAISSGVRFTSDEQKNLVP